MDVLREGQALQAGAQADDLVGEQSLAVLPLENISREPGEEYFADGMTEALINDLAQLSALSVTSRTSVMQYKRARKPLPEIALPNDIATRSLRGQSVLLA